MEEKDSKLRVVSRDRGGRCRYDKANKRALVEACLRPGVSVARKAQENGINANLLRVKRRVDSTGDLRPERTSWRCIFWYLNGAYFCVFFWILQRLN